MNEVTAPHYHHHADRIQNHAILVMVSMLIFAIVTFSITAYLAYRYVNLLKSMPTKSSTPTMISIPKITTPPTK